MHMASQYSFFAAKLFQSIILKTVEVAETQTSTMPRVQDKFSK